MKMNQNCNFYKEQNKYYGNEFKKYKDNTNKVNNNIAKLKIENSKNDNTS